MIPPDKATEPFQVKCVTPEEVEFIYRLADKLGWGWSDKARLLSKGHMEEDKNRARKGSFYLCFFPGKYPHVLRHWGPTLCSDAGKVINASDLLKAKSKSQYFCNACGTPMKFLFTSSYCPTCDGE